MATFIPKLDIEDITELYCEEWMTKKEIAEMYHISFEKLNAYLNENAIERTTPSVLSEGNLYNLHLMGYKQIDVIEKYDYLPQWLVRREVGKYDFFKKKKSAWKDEETIKQAIETIKKHLEAGKSVNEIDKITGFGRKRIYAFMKENNLTCPRSRKNAHITEDKKDQLVAEYKSNKKISIPELSKKHNIKEHKLYKIFKERGVNLEQRWSKPRPPKVKLYKYVAGSNFETLAGIPDQWHDLEGYEGDYKYNEDGLICYIGVGRPRLLEMKKAGDDYTYSTKLQNYFETKLPKISITRNELLRKAGVSI